MALVFFIRLSPICNGDATHPSFCGCIIPRMRILNKTSRPADRMRDILIVLSTLVAGTGLCAETAQMSDPLLDLFIQKGYVTQQEAAKVKAEADRLRTNELAGAEMPAPRWKINPGVKNMELFGDVRLRYEARSATDPAGGKIDLNRLRYAIRVGLRGEAFDDFYYGLRIETSANPRSSWVTMGTSSSSSNPYQGAPFSKSSASLNVGQAYLGWRPEDWVDITLGKMANPLYTTSMVWDGDLNPEGAAERFKYTVGEADFFATFGQFLYQDTNPTQTSAGYFNPVTVNSSSLPFLLALQGGMDYHLTKKVNFKVAPVLYYYTKFNVGENPSASGSGYNPDFSGTYVGQGSRFGVNGIPAYYNLANPGFNGFYANQTGINKLLVLEVPFEVDVKLEKFKLRFFGDYAQNLQGSDRAKEAYSAANSYYFSASGPGGGTIDPISSPQTRDIHAYQIGFGIGSTNLDYGPMQGAVYGNNTRRHAWELRTYWQHIEQYALDPNLIDSDLFEGRENMEGIYVALAYCFSENVYGVARYGYAQRINDKLGTGGSNGDIPQMNPIDSYSLFQVDLGVKF